MAISDYPAIKAAGIKVQPTQYTGNGKIYRSRHYQVIAFSRLLQYELNCACLRVNSFVIVRICKSDQTSWRRGICNLEESGSYPLGSDALWRHFRSGSDNPRSENGTF